MCINEITFFQFSFVWNPLFCTHPLYFHIRVAMALHLFQNRTLPEMYLVHLILIVIIIFFVKSVNRYELLLVNQAWRPATLLKKWFQHRCFPVNISKFLRTASLQNTSSGCYYIFYIKVNESRYIALFVVSESIKKLFLIDCVNIYLFSIFFFSNFCQYLHFLNIFFKRLFPVEKCGVTPRCLYHIF